METQRTFGVEIEFTAPVSHDVVAALISKGLQAAATYYSGRVGAGAWKVAPDTSIRANQRGHSGCEIVSPILQGDLGLRQLELALEAINELGAVVNRTCGIHVHWGADGMSVDSMRNLAKMYAKYETEVDKLMAPSRRASNNVYCKSIAGNRGVMSSEADIESHTKNLFKRLDRATSPSQIAEMLGSGRYAKLNFEAHWKHGTIEFRQHGGSTEFEKIAAWVKFTGAMVKAAEEASFIKPTGMFNFEAMMKLTKDTGLRRYLRKRAQELV